tara:strand:+ start:956 stop:1144 length:189 start_codon:yes stop_codon:yes gene_type:complete
MSEEQYVMRLDIPGIGVRVFDNEGRELSEATLRVIERDENGVRSDTTRTYYQSDGVTYKQVK